MSKKILVIAHSALALVAAAAILKGDPSVEFELSHVDEHDDLIDFIHENKGNYALAILNPDHIDIVENPDGLYLGVAITGLYSDLSDSNILNTLNAVFNTDRAVIAKLISEGKIVYESLKGHAQAFVSDIFGPDVSELETIAFEAPEEVEALPESVVIEEELPLEVGESTEFTAPEPEQIEEEIVKEDTPVAEIEEKVSENTETVSKKSKKSSSPEVTE